MDSEKNKKSVSDLTISFVEENPTVKSCLKKGFINYSALARKIADSNEIKNNSSFDAIVVALRRYKQKIDNKIDFEKSILSILSNSETSIKNKIVVFIMDKNAPAPSIDELQNKIKKEFGTFYLIEGTSTYTIITQDKYSELVNTKFKNYLLKKKNSLSMITINSSPEIEKTTGVLAFLSSLLAENGINIHEVISCWTDTIFVIDSKDLNKAIGLFEF